MLRASTPSASSSRMASATICSRLSAGCSRWRRWLILAVLCLSSLVLVIANFAWGGDEETMRTMVFSGIDLVDLELGAPSYCAPGFPC